MFLSQYKVLRSHKRQYIKDLSKVTLTERFRGMPQLTGGIDEGLCQQIAGICPTGAFSCRPFSVDLGRCCFCGECAAMAPGYIRFTNNYRMASASRSALVVVPGSGESVSFEPDKVRQEIAKRFGRALKLREVSAGGDNSTEMELNASMNVNFDLGRYGIEFVSSPRHADGIVVSGPVTANMARALDICFCSIAEPKIIIAAGCDAISGGLFDGSPALNRTFFGVRTPDLYIPGNPVHPMTFIDGVLRLIGKW